MEFALEGARAAGLPERRWEHVALVVEELFVNISSYAYAEGQRGEVEIRCETPERGVLSVEVADRGTEYNPLTRLEPNLPARLEDRAVGGLGIFLVRQLTDALEYQRDDGWNRIRFRMKAMPGA
jgi:serine/threonine-protein kinase RsbW